MRPDALREAIAAVRAPGRTPKLIYTIPSFHNPAASRRVRRRRAEVLEVARSNGILLLEDDPYGLLGFDGTVPRAIRADEAEGVIYLGTFSKTIAAGLRVGWAVAPHGVREKLVLANETATLCPSNLTQLTDLRLPRHAAVVRPGEGVPRGLPRASRRPARVARGAHARRARAGPCRRGGFYSWVTLPDGLDATAMLPRAVAALVAYVPGTGFFADGQGRQSLRLSYCYPEPDRIREGVRRLAGVIEDRARARADVRGAAPLVDREGPSAPTPDLA